MNDSAKSQGRALAWFALFIALGYSVAANVAYAHPSAGPRLAAAAAPVLVILAAGLLERVSMTGLPWWRRAPALLGLAVVIGAAFVTSFEHQFSLLVRYGDTRLSAALLPIAVDGLIVLASVCLTVIAERRRGTWTFDPYLPDEPHAQDAQPAVDFFAQVPYDAEREPIFAPEPAAQPTDDAAQDAPRPLRARSVARPHPRATRSAKQRSAKRGPTAQRHPLRDEVEARILAGETDLRALRASLNGQAPSLRSIQTWRAKLPIAQPAKATDDEG